MIRLPDLCGDIQKISSLVSKSNRSLAKFGLNDDVPSYLRQIHKFRDELMVQVEQTALC